MASAQKITPGSAGIPACNSARIFVTCVSATHSICYIIGVFDLTGAAVFFPDGYYLCCLPYGQYQEAFGFNLPNLEQDMEKRGTKYVHTDFFDRLDVLPPMQGRYVKENFAPFFSDGSLLIKK